MFTALSLLVFAGFQADLPPQPTASLRSRIDFGVSLIVQIAGTEDLARAQGRSAQTRFAQNLAALLKRSEDALREFQNLPSELQELAELDFVLKCETQSYKFAGRLTLAPQVPTDDSFAHLDRLEVMSVFAGTPTTIYPNGSIWFLTKDSSKGHLVLLPRTSPPAPTFKYDIRITWIPEAFQLARGEILAGKFLVPS
jgi:hypothetical protein